jgi:hypothetical protein
MIGLIIVINKYSSQETLTFNLKSIDEAKDKLITILVDNFKHLNVDFPLDISDFEYTWFNEESSNLPIFTYKIYNNDWITPWDEQDIYTDVLEKLYELEITTAPNFSELYGEPIEDSFEKNDELNDEKNDELNDELNDEKNDELNNELNDELNIDNIYTEFESIINNIIKKS